MAKKERRERTLLSLLSSSCEQVTGMSTFLDTILEYGISFPGQTLTFWNQTGCEIFVCRLVVGHDPEDEQERKEAEYMSKENDSFGER